MTASIFGRAAGPCVSQSSSDGGGKLKYCDVWPGFMVLNALRKIIAVRYICLTGMFTNLSTILLRTNENVILTLP